MNNFKSLLLHIDSCPVGWFKGVLIKRKGTTEEDVLKWLQKLIELKQQINEDHLNAINDVSNEFHFLLSQANESQIENCGFCNAFHKD